MKSQKYYYSVEYLVWNDHYKADIQCHASVIDKSDKLTDRQLVNRIHDQDDRISKKDIRIARVEIMVRA